MQCWMDPWCRVVPEDPVRDLQKTVAESNPREIPRLVNGIDTRSNRPLRWTPLQLALAWTDKKKTVEAIEELVVQGADFNAPALTGINALHTVLLLLFFRDHTTHDATMLEWWLSKGVDVHAPAIVLDTRWNVFRTFSPLDLLVALGTKTLRMDPCTYLPPFVAGNLRKHPRRPKGFSKFIALFLCYGGKTSEASTLVDRVYERVGALPFRSMSFLRDYVETRLKLPTQLSLHDLRHRVAFLLEHAAHADMDEIVDERERRLFPHDDDVVYANPNFEPRAEFMPHEYLGYRDEAGGKQYFFHKSMIASILQTKENPFTRHAIPSGILRKWFHEMSHRPYFFRLHMLRDAWRHDTLCMWDTERPLEKNAKDNHHAILHFVHGVLSHNFPYTNILRLLTLSDRELGYVARVLGREPYALDAYSGHDRLPGFLQTTMAYATDPQFSMDILYFGVEDALLDLSCYHLVKNAFRGTDMTFQDPFVDVITNHPSVGDIIRDRIGYVHLGYFYEIWQRLVSMNEIFS